MFDKSLFELETENVISTNVLTGTEIETSHGLQRTIPKYFIHISYVKSVFLSEKVINDNPGTQLCRPLCNKQCGSIISIKI